MSVSTISPSYSTTIKSNNMTNWADATGATSGVSEPPFSRVKCEAQSWREIHRGFFIFDTSSIPDNAVISSVILRHNPSSVYKAYTGYLQIRHITTASNNSFTGSDYNKANFGTLLATTLWNSLIQGSNNDFTLTNYTINLTGVTKIGYIASNDYDNSDPGNNAGNNLFGGNLPSLIITYSVPAVVTTGAATDLQPISATLAGNVTDAGGGTVSSRGVCWSTTANPTTSSPKATATGTTGAYTVSATGLLPGTLYHYRSFVITENSTQYGSDVTFRTPGGAILYFLL